MTGDRRFLEWAQRIGDAYVLEVLPGEPRAARLRVGLHEAHGPRPHAPARPRQRDRGRPGAAARARERPGRLARGVVSRAARPDARPHPGLGQSRRHALQRVPPVRPCPARRAAVGQLGLRLRRGVHALHGDRRRAVPRRGAARARQPAEVPRLRLGERQPRRLRGRDRERAVPLRARAGARGRGLDRERGPHAAGLPAAGRHHRALVRRRQLVAHAPALRDVEDAGHLPRRLARGREARRRARRRAAARLPGRARRTGAASCASTMRATGAR